MTLHFIAIAVLLVIWIIYRATHSNLLETETVKHARFRSEQRQLANKYSMSGNASGAGHMQDIDVVENNNIDWDNLTSKQEESIAAIFKTFPTSRQQPARYKDDIWADGK